MCGSWIDARAEEYDASLPALRRSAVADPGGFNFQQFRSNVVFRWEYRPGSTLFLVWSQGREAARTSPKGTTSFRGDMAESLRPAGERHVSGEGFVLVREVGTSAVSHQPSAQAMSHKP